MTDRIEKNISLFFDDLPYSEGLAEAREKIGARLEEAAAGELSPDKLAAGCGGCEKPAEVADYTPQDAESWRSREGLRDGETVEREGAPWSWMRP